MYPNNFYWRKRTRPIFRQKAGKKISLLLTALSPSFPSSRLLIHLLPRRRRMPPPAGLLPWPAPSAARLAARPGRALLLALAFALHPLPLLPRRHRLGSSPSSSSRRAQPRPPRRCLPSSPPPCPPPPPRASNASTSTRTALSPRMRVRVCERRRSDFFDFFFLMRDLCRCSGCTHEVDLDKPPVLQEVENFFKGHGVGDFTFSRGRLVRVASKQFWPCPMYAIRAVWLSNLLTWCRD